MFRDHRSPWLGRTHAATNQPTIPVLQCCFRFSPAHPPALARLLCHRSRPLHVVLGLPSSVRRCTTPSFLMTPLNPIVVPLCLHHYPFTPNLEIFFFWTKVNVSKNTWTKAAINVYINGNINSDNSVNQPMLVGCCQLRVSIRAVNTTKWIVWNLNFFWFFYC